MVAQLRRREMKLQRIGAQNLKVGAWSRILAT